MTSGSLNNSELTLQGDILDGFASDAKSLLSGITGAPASYISSLTNEATSVRESLESKITGAPASLISSLVDGATSIEASLASKYTETGSANGAVRTGVVGAAALFGGGAALMANL